jgi:hypothetical protein
MAMYNLYVGLSGGFGGAHYYGTFEFEDKKEAEEEAYNLAVEEYQSYEGYHGLPSYSDIMDDFMEEEGMIDEGELSESDREDIDETYTEEVESWIAYFVTSIEEDPDHDRD